MQTVASVSSTNANGPFALGPEAAIQLSQLLGGLRARKLGAGMVGLVRPIMEVEEVAGHHGFNAVPARIVAFRKDNL
jgi:hypothetical protein